MVADEFDEGWDIRLPVGRKLLQILKNRIDAELMKQGDGVFGVFVKIGVENS